MFAATRGTWLKRGGLIERMIERFVFDVAKPLRDLSGPLM